MVYIYVNALSPFVGLDFELGENYLVGNCYEDYLSGKWVKLNEQQEAFHKSHPSASAREVFNLALNPPYAPTLEDVRRRKISEVTQYDQSTEVNSFFISGTAMWLSKEMRVGLMNSVSIEKTAGRSETKLWFNGHVYTMAIEQAIELLNLLELYALDCYNTTQQHIANINELETMKEVEAYDIMANYPQKLSFLKQE